MNKKICILLAAISVAACSSSDNTVNDYGNTAPTKYTIKANQAVADKLPLADQRDFENAKRGLIAQAESLVVKRGDKTLWNQDQYQYMQGDAPDSVNPSLWRQAKLNNIHGLFKVTDGIYQIRGYDLANMTIIEGKEGWTIVDPLTAKETAAAAYKFAQQHLGKKPLKAIIFTHTHIDHFGGVTGIISAADAKAQDVKIIAPEGFTEEATSENVMAGVAMQRRASYMYGKRLPRNNRGHVGTGLGKEPPFGGHIGFINPNLIVHTTGQTEVIDGLGYVFQYAPESEAPAELTFYIPQKKAYCGGEVVSRNLHNLYTLRGAKVRDGLKWSNYIQEALDLFGDAEIYFGTHQWPEWGNANIREFIIQQRDTYKFIHDQALRLANQGYTPKEIADMVKLPESLQTGFSNRSYYGTVAHNSKAVYQWYFGWYDGNPANLQPLPPGAAAEKYVQFMGDADNVLEQAQTSFDNGDYRWVAEVLNHLVFAEPDNTAAKALLANTHDQLAYQAESAPWRDVHLSAAYELRHGGAKEGVDLNDAIDLLREIPVAKFFDSMAATVNPEKADGKNMALNIQFTDLNQNHVLWLENTVLHHRPGKDDNAVGTIKMTHNFFVNLVVGNNGLKEMLFSDEVGIEGSRLDTLKFLSVLDKPDGKFNIVVP